MCSKVLIRGGLGRFVDTRDQVNTTIPGTKVWSMCAHVP